MRPDMALMLSPRFEQLRIGVAAMATWRASRWVVAVLSAIVAGLVMGIPTGIVQTSLYRRMTPVTWWDYPIWALASVLVGLTAATYLRDRHTPPAGPDRTARTMGAGLLSVFAIGCPICNKLVVALLGVSGALTYWAPIQPILGVLSLALLTAGLGIRLRGMTNCRLTPEV